MVIATAEPGNGVEAARSSKAELPVHKRSTIGRFDIRCVTCRYGAIVEQHQNRCPMCGNDLWEFVGWRPFSERGANNAERARCFGI